MGENCKNCIYLTRNKDYDCPECLHRGTLMSDEEVESRDNMCRIWDAYIPKEATEEEIEYAQKWQDMPYSEQPDYDEYFGDMTELYYGL